MNSKHYVLGKYGWNWNQINGEDIEPGMITAKVTAYSEDDIAIQFSRWYVREDGYTSNFSTEFSMYYRAKSHGADPTWEYSSASRRGDLTDMYGASELLGIAVHFVHSEFKGIMEEYWKEVGASTPEALDD